MNAHVAAALTEADIVPVAKSLVSKLKERAIQTDSDRMVPQENIKLLADSGLLRILRGKKYGGSELSAKAHVNAVSTIAEGCMATAWCLGVYHAHDYIIGHMPEQAREEIYAGGLDVAVAAVIGPRGKAVLQDDGSYRLTGFWPFVSGNAASTWLLLGGEVFDKDGNVVNAGDFAVPIEDVERLDDWHVAGLQGTGSNSVRVNDVVVPAHRFVSLPAIIECQTETWTDPSAPATFKMMGTPALGLFIVPSTLGAAKQTMEEFKRVVPGKAVQYTDHISHEWSAIQIALGEAAAMIHAAELVLHKIADDIDHWAQKGEKMPMETRARIRMDICMVPRLCRDAVTKLYTVGGAAGLSLKSPIQLNARNLQAANMHGLLLYDAGAEIYGRVLLGVDPGTALL